MDMHEKIRYLRKLHGLTLEEVGNIVGVGKSTVRKWENGIISNMKRDKIAKLAEALHTTPAYLMGWDDEAEENQPEAENKKLDDDEVWAFREAMRRRPQFKVLFDMNHKQISEKDKDLICDFIDRLTHNGEND